MSDLNDQFDDDFEAFDDFEDFGDDSFGDSGSSPEPVGLTAEQERKLEKFQTRVKRATRVLTSSNSSAENRIKAAEWLGESGEPTAITALRQAYRNDPDKKVQRAAEQSLGMFRALERALDDPERAEEVQQLLQDIIFEGHMGSSSGLAGNIRRIQILLVVTFIALMGIGLLTSSGVLSNNALPTAIPTLTPFVSPTPQPTVSPIDFIGELLTMHDDLVFDAELLAERYQQAIQEEPLGCDVTTFRMTDEFFAPTGFEPDQYPQVSEFISQLNTIRNDLETLRTAYDDACSGLSEITPAIANEQWTALIPIQTSLSTNFSAMIENPDFIGGEVIPTLTPRPSPTPFPTATVEPSVINGIILQLDFNITEMNQAVTGINDRLIQFWADLETGGTTLACRDETPLLPADYTISEQQRIDLPADLIAAIDAYNFGMQLARDSWAQFRLACNSDDRAAQITQGKTQAELAKTSFDEAVAAIGRLSQ